MEEEAQGGEPAENSTAPGSGPIRKKDYTKLIVGGVVVLVAIVAARYYLSPQRIAERAIESASGGAANVNIGDNGGTVTVTGKDGSNYTATAGESVKLPDGWPSSVPLESDAKLTYAAKVNGTDATNGFSVIYTTGSSPADVAAYYQKALVSNGWSIQSTVDTGDGSLISATQGDNNNAVVNIGTDSGTTNVSLTVQVPK